MPPISEHFRFLRRKRKERPEISAVRQAILNRLLYVVSLVGLPAVCVGASQAFLQGRRVFSSIYVGFYLLFLLATFGSHRLAYNARAVILVSCLYLIGLAILVRIGLSGVGVLILVGTSYLSAVLFGIRGGMIAIGFSMVTMGLVGAGMTTGFMEIHSEHMLTSVSPMAWITFLCVFLMIAGVIVLAPEMFSKRIEKSLDLIEDQKVKLEIANQHLLGEIDERRRAEEALGASERKYRSVIENIQDVFYRLDKNGELLMTSPSGVQTFGYGTMEEMIGLPLKDFMADDSQRQSLIETLKEHGHMNDFESVMRRKDGSTFTASSTVHFYYDDDGRAVGTEGIIRDITERKRGEEETRRLRNYLANVFNSMPSVLVGVDGGGRITQWNRAAEEMTGTRAMEAQGRPMDQLLPVPAHEMEKIYRAIRNRSVMTENKIPRVEQGETRYQDLTVYPLITNGVEGAVIRMDDVTERVRMEEMMIQSEKMLSVGGLAAGMAHEINNPLGVILQASQNVLRRVSPDLAVNSRIAEACGTTLAVVRAYLEQREIPDFLEDIRKSGERAAEIVSNMLSFSRKADVGGSSTDLAELLDKSLSLAATDYDLKKKYDFRKIEIVREYEPGAPLVVCQASKIQQVFLNILRNGAEAMSEHRENRQAQGEPYEPARFVLRVKPEGEMVRVEIEDNGPGMDEATRRRVFEPFFTTKAPGIGTGLGLSVSYFIITEAHQGALSVESNPGEGARFIMRLPSRREDDDRKTDPDPDRR